MRILVLGINYRPELTGIGVYTTDMCEYFSRKGHDVEIVTGFPFYPQWEIEAEYQGRIYLAEKIQSVSVKRCYLYLTKNLTVLKRILHEASFILTSFFCSLFLTRPDVIVVISPPLGLGVSGYLLSKFKRAPLVFHVQDLQPDAAVGLEMLKKSRLIKMLYVVERFIYTRSRLITTISKSMRHKIIAKGIESAKVKLVPNWATLGISKSSDGSLEFRKELGLESKFIFLYSGNVGEKQGLEVLVDAFAGLEAENAICLIVGDGANIFSLEKRAKESGAANIMFLPLQPKERLLDLLRLADVCLVVQKKAVSDIVFPSKMANIMAAGCVSLVTADKSSDLAQAVIDSESGYIAIPEDSASLRVQMLEAYNDKTLSEKRKRALKYAVTNFDKRAVLDRFESMLASLLIDSTTEKWTR